MKKNLSQIYTFWRGPSAILTIYNQIFFSRGPSALIFRDLSFLIWFNGFCQKKSAFLYEIWSDFSYDHFFSTEKHQNHSKIDVLQIARNSRALWWKIIKFYTQNMPRKNFSPAKTARNCIFLEKCKNCFFALFVKMTAFFLLI